MFPYISRFNFRKCETTNRPVTEAVIQVCTAIWWIVNVTSGYLIVQTFSIFIILKSLKNKLYEFSIEKKENEEHF